jgi:hypothetical protein
MAFMAYICSFIEGNTDPNPRSLQMDLVGYPDCQNFLGILCYTKKVKNIPNEHKIYESCKKCIKWSQNSTYCYILHYILLHTTLHTVTYYITYCYILHYILLHTTLHTVHIPTYCSQYLRNWDVKKMIETERIKFLSSKLKHFEQLVNALGNRPQKYPE